MINKCGCGAKRGEPHNGAYEGIHFEPAPSSETCPDCKYPPDTDPEVAPEVGECDNTCHIPPQPPQVEQEGLCTYFEQDGLWYVRGPGWIRVYPNRGAAYNASLDGNRMYTQGKASLSKKLDEVRIVLLKLVAHGNLCDCLGTNAEPEQTHDPICPKRLVQNALAIIPSTLKGGK